MASRRLPVSLIAGTGLGLIAIGLVLVCAQLDASVFGGLLVAVPVALLAGFLAVVLHAKLVRPLVRRDGTRVGLKTGAVGALLTIPSLFGATFLNGNSPTFLPGGVNLRSFFYVRYGMQTGHLLILLAASFLVIIFFMASARVGGMLAEIIFRRDNS